MKANPTSGAAQSVWRVLTGRLETRLLLMGAVIAAAVIGFAALAVEAREGDIGALDSVLLLAFRSTLNPTVGVGPRWLTESMRDITALGGFTVLTLVSIAATVILLMRRPRREAVVFAGAVIFAQITSEATKHLVDRPRPALVNHLDLVYSSSFPSGHALMSPVVYLTLASILGAAVASRVERASIVGAAAALSIAIGVSRVYLGVHWPTDVLGGWIVGALIAMAASIAVRERQTTRKVA